MSQLPRSSAKDVFSYLLAIVTLYIGVVSFIAIRFQCINLWFPDPLSFDMGAQEIMRMAMASFIVAWPVFLLISWLIYRDMKLEPSKTALAIRKWLLYLTLFVTSIAIIVDLITLVNYFLNGEITTRFVLKVLVVLIVTGAVFGYYLWDLRRDVQSKTKVPMIFAVVTVVFGIAGIVVGFIIAGTPAEQRATRLDEQRVSDLSNLQYQVGNYFSLKRQLPAQLEDLNDVMGGFVVPSDPETLVVYEYSVKGENEFELCANFDRSSEEENITASRYQMMYNQNWTHTVGHQCFSRTIDPEMYPPVSGVKGEIVNF